MTWDELRSEAFGEIGILPDVFYMMERDDYWLLQEGYYNKRVHFMQDLRWAVTPIVSVWTKDFDPFRHMPLTGDDELRKRIKDSRKKIKVSESSLEVLRRFKEMEANQKPKEN